YASGEGVDVDLDASRLWAKKASKLGNARAMRSFAIFLLAEDETKKALKMYQDAASKGDTPSMIELSRIYAGGEHVAKDQKKALKWLELAASNGSAEAMVRLVENYSGDGQTIDGLKPNYEASEKWAGKLAEVGRTEGHYYLGVIFRDRDDGKRDYAKSYLMFSKSANSGNPSAMKNISMLYKSGGPGLPKNKTLADHWHKLYVESRNNKQ
ncbi:MAG: tetratricopeptide repeat protein, partial [Phycisphaeraceae bacterium]|nr:tetratricopeptide repeat protein [Phycisphaeraceae bacterium]